MHLLHFPPIQLHRSPNPITDPEDDYLLVCNVVILRDCAPFTCKPEPEMEENYNFVVFF